MSKCPPWSADGPSTRDGAFHQACRAAYQSVGNCAIKKIVNSGDCCGWHRTMFSSRVPLDYYAGNFRQIDPSRPCLRINVQVAGIPGETPERVGREIELLFQDMETRLVHLEIRWSELTARERAEELAVTLGVMVGRFIQIHPFINGNGRTSRLLWAWGLMRVGVPPQFRIGMHPEHPTYNEVMAKAMKGDFVHLSLFILKHLAKNSPRMPTGRD